MTRSVTVFGFGSSFSNRSSAEDIDLLIVHDDVSSVSCALAIQCKRCLERQIGHAHVTMLSASEERNFSFQKTAQASQLGTVRASHLEDDVATLCSQYSQLCKT